MNNFRPIKTLLLLSLFWLSFNSCVRYKRYSMVSSRLEKVNPAGLSVYLLDAAHPLTRGWYLSEPKFEKKSVSGFLVRMAEVEVLEVVEIRNRRDGQLSKNDLLLYAKPELAAQWFDTATVVIPNKQLERVEVCEMDQMRSIGVPLLGCTAGISLIGLLWDND